MVLPVDRTKTNVNTWTEEGPLSDLPDPDKVPGGIFYFATDTEQLFLSVRRDGVPPFWFSVMFASGGDFIRYLAPVSGKDSNDGLTPQTPIKTLDEVKRRLPALVGGKCRVFVIEAGTNVMPSGGIVLPQPINPGNTSGGEGESLVIDARGALVITDPGRVVTADDPFGGTITYAGAALPRDTLIKMTSGAASGFYGTIRSTVAGAPNVSVMFSGFFPFGTFTGDTFDVVEQGYVIDASAGDGQFFFGVPGLKGPLSIVAVKFIGGYGFGARGTEWGTPLCVFNTIGGGVTVADRGGSWVRNALPNDLNDGTMDFAAIVTYGDDGFGNGGSLNANVDCEIDVGLQATNTATACERGCELSILPYSLVNSPVLQVQPTLTSMAGFAPFPGFDSEMTGLIAGFNWNLDQETNPAPLTAAIRIAGGGGTIDTGFSGNASISVTRIEGNDGDGIQLADGALANLIGVTTDPLNPNTGTGAVVTNGAKLHYDDATAAGATPLTGTKDATLDGDTYTWFAIDAAAGAAAGLDANGNILSKKAVIDSHGSVIALDP